MPQKNILTEIIKYTTECECDCVYSNCNKKDKCPVCEFCTDKSHSGEDVGSSSNQHKKALGSECIFYGLTYTIGDTFLNELTISSIAEHVCKRLGYLKENKLLAIKLVAAFFGNVEYKASPMVDKIQDIVENIYNNNSPYSYANDKYNCLLCNELDKCPEVGCGFCTNTTDHHPNNIHASSCFYYGLKIQIPKYFELMSDKDFSVIAKFIAEKFNYDKQMKVAAIKKLRAYVKCGLMKAMDEIDKYIPKEEMFVESIEFPKQADDDTLKKLVEEKQAHITDKMGIPISYKPQIKTIGLEDLGKIEPGKKYQSKYKLFIWKYESSDNTGITYYKNWTVITAEVSLTAEEIKSIFDNPTYDENYIIFAKKAGLSKKYWLGGAYKYPCNVTKNFVNQLYERYLNKKKGVANIEELDNTTYEPYHVGIAKKKKESAFYKNYKPHTEVYIEAPEIISPDRTWFLDKLGCNDFPARSQKIKGLRYKTSVLERVTNVNTISNAIVVSEEKNFDIDHTHKDSYNHYKKNSIRATKDSVMDKMIGYFTRPCPQNPEHGFVDSRLVMTKEEAEKIIEEIYATGEIPEMIIMPKIECNYSSIICPDRIAFGKNNDGATQGDNAVGISLNIPPEGKDKVRESFWSDDKWPYAEVLYQDGSGLPTLVQLRAGPSMDIKAKKVRVVEVHNVDSSMDLIEWGKEAKKIRDKVKELNKDNGSGVENTIAIWHPGGEFLSHFGVHCRTEEPTLAYITTIEKPKIGEVIEIGVKGKIKLQAIKDGILEGLDAKLDGGKKESKEWWNAVNDLKSFIGMLHISSIMDLSDEVTAKYLGYTFAVGARIISALPFGECTHQSKAQKDLIELITKTNMPQHERDYIRIWNLDIGIVIAGLEICYNSFIGYKWNEGYGGKAWGNCTKLLIKVFQKMKSFINSPAQEGYDEMIESINVMVNAAHNNGWWLNKMTTKEVFDNASILPHFMLRPMRAFEARDIKIGSFQGKLRTIQAIKKLNVDWDMIEKKQEEMKIEAEKKKAEEDKLAIENMKAYEENLKKQQKIEEEKNKKTVEDLKALTKKENIESEFSIIGQYYLHGSQVHIQAQHKIKVNKEYGLSGDVILSNSTYVAIVKTKYTNPKNKGNYLESLTTKGKFAYLPLQIVKSSKVVGGWFIFEDKTIVPWLDVDLHMKLTKLEKGEGKDEDF